MSEGPAERCQWQGCRAVPLVIFHRQWRKSVAGSFLSQNQTINPENLALLFVLRSCHSGEKNDLV